MRVESRASLAAGRDRLEALVSARDVDPGVIGEELFAVTGLLAANGGVRRALTDPARDGQEKADLVGRLLGERVGGATVDLLAGLVRARWADGHDLTDATEQLGVQAVLASAERAGRLDDVEDELFRFARAFAGDVSLRDACAARTQGDERKAALVHRLLDGRVGPETLALAVHAAVHPRGRRTEAVLEAYVEAAARRRRELVAEVVAAAPLDDGQLERLSAALRRLYSVPIRLNVNVDPAVVGGLRVRVRDEVIDATTARRLDDVRRRLAG